MVGGCADAPPGLVEPTRTLVGMGTLLMRAVVDLQLRRHLSLSVVGRMTRRTLVVVMQMHSVRTLLVRMVRVHMTSKGLAMVIATHVVMVFHFSVLHRQLVKCCKLDWVETLLAE